MQAKKWLLMLAVAALCGASAVSAAPSGLSASLEADQAFLTGADAAVVRVTLRNASSQDLYVPFWQTAVRGVHGNIFDVRVDGRSVAYVGRLYKWATPKAEDFVRVQAGREVSADVDLSRYYDMTRTGEYTVRYRATVQDALRGTGTNLADAAGVREVASNTLVLGIERDERGRFLQNLAQSQDDGIGSATGEYLSPGFVSCVSTRQTTLVSALSSAESMSLTARNYLNNLPPASQPTDSAYKTWFGAYTSARYSTVQSHFNSIYSAFNTKAVTFYCDCTSSAYAYVYTNQPYQIHLCNAFWNAPLTGIDSKAGTLIHEISHFTVVAGTQDYAYGTSACRDLAIKKPDRAVNNADSHEYFAETR